MAGGIPGGRAPGGGTGGGKEPGGGMPIEEMKEELMIESIFKEPIPIGPLEAGYALFSPSQLSKVKTTLSQHNFDLLERLGNFPPHNHHP